jgi:hypothetical protein
VIESSEISSLEQSIGFPNLKYCFWKFNGLGTQNGIVSPSLALFLSFISLKKMLAGISNKLIHISSIPIADIGMIVYPWDIANRANPFLSPQSKEYGATDEGRHTSFDPPGYTKIGAHESINLEQDSRVPGKVPNIQPIWHHIGIWKCNLSAIPLGYMPASR